MGRLAAAGLATGLARGMFASRGLDVSLVAPCTPGNEGAAVVAQTYIRGHMARRFVRRLRSKRRAMAAAVHLEPTAPPTLENF